MSSFNDSGGEDGGDICKNIFDLFADSGLDQSGLSNDRLCFILCFVVAQNGVWKIYRLSSFFFFRSRQDLKPFPPPAQSNYFWPSLT